MNSEKRKRGRPKGSQTLEREKTEALFKNLPAHTKMSSEEREELEKWLAESKKIEDQIYAGHSPTIPHDLILAVESLGDRGLFEEDDWVRASEHKTIKNYQTLVTAEQEGRTKGTRITSDKSKVRANSVWSKNSDLIGNIGHRLTLHGASQKILDAWATRGDDGKKPSIRTIQNWYNKYCK